LKALRDRSVFTVSWYDAHLTRRLVFKAMKRALDMVPDYLAFAQLHTPVGAFVPKAVHFPRAVSPEDEFLSHPDNADRLISNLG